MTGEDLPLEPYRFHHFQYIRDKYLVPITDDLDDVLRRSALQDAHRNCHLVPGDGSWRNSSTRQTVIGDATVVSSLAKSPTGNRADPTAALYKKGGEEGEWARGNQHVILSTASFDDNRFYVLGIDWVSTPGAEMKHIEERYRKILEDARAIHPDLITSLTYDLALYPELRDRLMREGVIPIVRTRTARDEKAAKKGMARILILATAYANILGPHPMLPWIVATTLRDVDLPTPSSSYAVSITAKLNGTEVDPTTLGIHYYAEEGAPVAYEMDVNGELVRMEEQPTQTRVHRRGKPGRYRFYSDWKHRTPHGTLTFQIRHHHGTDDYYKQSRLFYIIHREHEFYAKLNNQRNNIENVNSVYKGTLHRGRANTLGGPRQSLMIIGWAFAHNAEINYRHRMKNAPPKAA